MAKKFDILISTVVFISVYLVFSKYDFNPDFTKRLYRSKYWETEFYFNLENRLAEILERQNKFCSNLGSNIESYLAQFSSETRKIKKMEGIRFGKISHILSKKVFSICQEDGTLIFWEMELSSPKNKKLQEGTLQAQ